MQGDRTGQTAVIFLSRRTAASADGHADAATVRAAARADWYDAYEVAVATVGRSYRWTAE